MKKLILWTASLIFLGSIGHLSASSLKADKCADESTANGRDDCYLEVATRDVYSGKKPEYNIGICKKITASTWRQAKCYWGYAMNQKKLSICSLLPKSSRKIITKIFSDDPDYGQAMSVKKYAYRTNCKNELYYKYKDAYWKRGGEFLTDRYTLYEGQATIKGWIMVIDPYNNGDTEKVFHITAGEEQKLPISWQNKADFRLSVKDSNGKFGNPIPEETMLDLEKYTGKNPATITIDSVLLPMEGTPFLGFVKLNN